MGYQCRLGRNQRRWQCRNLLIVLGALLTDCLSRSWQASFVETSLNSAGKSRRARTANPLLRRHLPVASPTGRACMVSSYAAAEAASPNVPAIAAVVSAAAVGSLLQLTRAFGTSTQTDAASKITSEDNFFGNKRWAGRTAAVAMSWALLLGYAVLFAPGKSPEAQQEDTALLGKLLSTPFDGTVSSIFVCIFNMLGIWPVIYAATVLPGADRQSPVPAWPFVGGSFFFGAFALAPYLAVREYRGIQGTSGSLDWVTQNVLENRLTALSLLAGASYLALYALGDGQIGSFALTQAWAGYLPVFMGSLTAHVSCMDFAVLWMLYAPVLLEDGRRRGCFLGAPSTWKTADLVRFALGAGLPVFGGCAWLPTRPALPSEES
eukprot:TRINITY_DN44475_c0_g1_i1.p1 TRINITY_DN44475_c0_g1~~TRINITY_DN44475_c0_g1_i1.p1  ORF type:complete len:378 (+),score=32.34 TRINITY_DN44475_c0_g1_i1:67-1200(+)